MRARTPIVILSLIASFAILLVCVRALADTPSYNQDKNGLNGPINLPFAVLNIMDKSWPQSSLIDGDNVDALQIYFLRNNYGYSYPPVIFGTDFQIRSYDRGPTIYSPELYLSDFPAGIDLSYQRFEGSFYGDGIGARINLLRGRTYPDTYPADPSDLRKKRSLDIYKTKEQLDKAIDQLNALGSEDIEILLMGSDNHRRLDEFTFQELETRRKKLDPNKENENRIASIIDNLTMKKENYKKAIHAQNVTYAKYAHDPTLSLILGYRTLNIGAYANLGISYSRLWNLGNLDKMLSTPGLLLLLSAQDLYITSAAAANRGKTNLIQYGFSLAWQNKVPSELRPHDRWNTQLGFEYTFRTSFGSSPTYGFFARFRPVAHYAHGMVPAKATARNYVPLDFSLFGGWGPSGRGFIGARAGFAFAP